MRRDAAAPRSGVPARAPARLGAGVLLLLGLVPALVPAGPLRAQTPFTATGLGYPVPSVDARVAALGGVGAGLLGGGYSLRNPAELTEHGAAALSITGAAEGVDVEGTGASFGTGRSRIPAVRAVAPLGEWAVGVGFGSELDQDWSVRFQDTLEVSQGTFPYEESRESDGGLGLVELALARRLGPVSLGVAGQRLTGSLRQEFTRRFEADTAGSAIDLGNVSDRIRVSYGGWRVKVGASVRLADRFLVGGAYGSTSDVTAETEATGEEKELGMPDSWEVGASARALPSLLVTAGGGWTGWSSADEDLPASARDTRWVGAGLEYTGTRWLGMSLPLRVGLRTAELPFTPTGFEGQPEERALSLGFGAVFRGGVAELNAAFEIGTRGDQAEDGLEESFRRLTATFVLRQ